MPTENTGLCEGIPESYVIGCCQLRSVCFYYKCDARAQTRRLSLLRYWTRGTNRREGLSSLQFFNSPGDRKFAITCKVVSRF